MHVHPFSPFTTPHRAPPRRAHSTARRPLVVTHRLCTMFSVSATASRAHAAPAFVNKVSKVRPFSTTLSRARARPPARDRGEGHARCERAPPSPRPRTRAGGVSRRPRDATRDAIDAWTRRGRAMKIFYVASARFQRARARRWTDRETNRPRD